MKFHLLWRHVLARVLRAFFASPGKRGATSNKQANTTIVTTTEKSREAAIRGEDRPFFLKVMIVVMVVALCF